MGLFSFLGVLSPVHINSAVIFRGARRVGRDSFGNKYYKLKPRKGYKNERRWVIYKGAPDASAIPPEWHGWMHHQTDVVPSSETKSFRRKWQKPHQSNMTGTEAAYRPPANDLTATQCSKDVASKNYESWTPPK